MPANYDCKGWGHQVNHGYSKCSPKNGECGHWCTCGKKWFKSKRPCKRHSRK